MKRHLLASLFLLFAWLAAPGFGQLPRTEALLKDFEGRHLFYGSVLVKRGGANLFQGAYGPHEPPYPVPRNAPDSAYYLAGCGELFGGALAMMAVEKGLMALDEPIGTYVPAFKGRPGPYRDLVLLNAGAAIMAGGRADTLREGVALAAEAIDSGGAMRKLDDLKEFTRSLD